MDIIEQTTLADLWEQDRTSDYSIDSTRLLIQETADLFKKTFEASDSDFYSSQIFKNLWTKKITYLGSKEQVTTLDKFINDRKNEISSDTKLFIKIDLEGYDINAVYGSKNIINNYFTVLLVEFSKMAVTSKVYSKSDFDKFLKENDLSILDISGKQITLDSIHSMLHDLKGNHQVCGNFIIAKEKLFKNLKFNSYN